MRCKILLGLGFLLSSSQLQAQSLSAVDELHLTVEEEKLPSNVHTQYMRVILDREIPKNKYVLFVLPSNLDGYYFGADAERYYVSDYTLYQDPIGLEVREMEDQEDFQACKLYLVKSTGAMSQIVCQTPASPTAIKKSNLALMCMQIDEWGPIVPLDVTDVEKEENPLTSDQIYNLAGQLVHKARSGIYIVNGKKVFVK